MRIYVAFHRCAAATLGYVRLSTLPRVILARLELLVSPHFSVTDNTRDELYR